VVDTSRPFRVLVPDLRTPTELVYTKKGAGSRYAAPRSAIASDQWPAIVASAQANGLRIAASALGVSHEAVRQLVRALGKETGGADRHAVRDQRIRELALAGVLWTGLAERFGMSASGVRYVCRDLPARQARRTAVRATVTSEQAC